MKLESMGHRRLSRQLAAVLASREAEDVISAALRVLGERARFQSALASPASVRSTPPPSSPPRSPALCWPCSSRTGCWAAGAPTDRRHVSNAIAAFRPTQAQHPR